MGTLINMLFPSGVRAKQQRFDISINENTISNALNYLKSITQLQNLNLDFNSIENSLKNINSLNFRPIFPGVAACPLMKPLPPDFDPKAVPIKIVCFQQYQNGETRPIIPLHSHEGNGAEEHVYVLRGVQVNLKTNSTIITTLLIILIII